MDLQLDFPCQVPFKVNRHFNLTLGSLVFGEDDEGVADPVVGGVGEEEG